MDRRIGGTWGWFLQRLTALYLVFGLAVHFLYTHFFMQRPVTFEQVRERLLAPHWVLFDVSLLATAVFHGFNGVWGLILDWNIRPGWRRAVGWLIVLLGVLVTAWGVRSLIPFARAGYGG